MAIKELRKQLSAEGSKAEESLANHQRHVRKINEQWEKRLREETEELRKKLRVAEEKLLETLKTTSERSKILSAVQAQEKVDDAVQLACLNLREELRGEMGAEIRKEVEEEYLLAIEETREQIWEEAQHEVFEFLQAHDVGEEVLGLVQLMGRASTAMQEMEAAGSLHLLEEAAQEEEEEDLQEGREENGEEEIENQSRSETFFDERDNQLHRSSKNKSRTRSRSRNGERNRSRNVGGRAGDHDVAGHEELRSQGYQGSNSEQTFEDLAARLNTIRSNIVEKTQEYISGKTTFHEDSRAEEGSSVFPPQSNTSSKQAQLYPPASKQGSARPAQAEASGSGEEQKNSSQLPHLFYTDSKEPSAFGGGRSFAFSSEEGDPAGASAVRVGTSGTRSKSRSDVPSSSLEEVRRRIEDEGENIDFMQEKAHSMNGGLQQAQQQTAAAKGFLFRGATDDFDYPLGQSSSAVVVPPGDMLLPEEVDNAEDDYNNASQTDEHEHLLPAPQPIPLSPMRARFNLATLSIKSREESLSSAGSSSARLQQVDYRDRGVEREEPLSDRDQGYWDGLGAGDRDRYGVSSSGGGSGTATAAGVAGAGTGTGNAAAAARFNLNRQSPEFPSVFQPGTVFANAAAPDRAHASRNYKQETAFSSSPRPTPGVKSLLSPPHHAGADENLTSRSKFVQNPHSTATQTQTHQQQHQPGQHHFLPPPRSQYHGSNRATPSHAAQMFGAGGRLDMFETLVYDNDRAEAMNPIYRPSGITYPMQVSQTSASSTGSALLGGGPGGGSGTGPSTAASTSSSRLMQQLPKDSLKATAAMLTPKKGLQLGGGIGGGLVGGGDQGYHQRRKSEPRLMVHLPSGGTLSGGGMGAGGGLATASGAPGLHGGGFSYDITR
eukprot:g10486.t1